MVSNPERGGADRGDLSFDTTDNADATTLLCSGFEPDVQKSSNFWSFVAREFW